MAGGADVVVDYTDDGWQKYVMHITGGRGVDVIYDPVGMVKSSCKPPFKTNKKVGACTLHSDIDGFYIL